MATDLFVYGTLQDPEVLGALLDDPPPLTPVTVAGWRVAPVRGQVYPALVPDTQAVARGRHLRIEVDQLAVLDSFEGPGYDRRAIGAVQLDGTRVPVEAWVAEGIAHLCGPGTWTLEGFHADPDRAGWVGAIERGRSAPRHES